MKIIDQRGRIFGKLNVFDLLVLLVLLALVFFASNKYIGKSTTSAVATKDLTFKLFIHNVREITTETIQVGDKVSHFETNELMGEIMEKEIMPALTQVVTWDGAIVNAEIPEKFDMLLTVKGEGIVTDREIILASKPIRLGSQVKVRTNRYEVQATVFGIEYQE